MFKPAKSKNSIWNLLKTLVQTGLFWLIFLYLIPMLILEIESIIGINGFSGRKEFAWILFVIFSLLGVFSGYTMSWRGRGTPLPLDCPNKLVIEGPYKFVRNPMAIAGIGQGVCVGIILGSYVIVLYSIVGAFLWHLLVRPLEERDLENRFGKPYLEYKSRISCWIPSIKYVN
jgi:protein-S-isoprenylcysteine O-methyltransferase Ste14